MTKKEALIGLLNGTYDKIRARNFNKNAYVFIKNNGLYFKFDERLEPYTEMLELNDVSWDVANVEWYKNIPEVGTLVLFNSVLKRAIRYDGTDVIFDDNTTTTPDNCSLLTRDESISLHSSTLKLN